MGKEAERPDAWAQIPGDPARASLFWEPLAKGAGMRFFIVAAAAV